MALSRQTHAHGVRWGMIGLACAVTVSGASMALGDTARDGVPNPDTPPDLPQVDDCLVPQPQIAWLTTEDETVNLGTWDCGTWSHAYGISADGTRIAGSSVRSATGIMTGFYLDDSGTMQPLPFLSGGTAVDIRAISGDGSTMAGGANSAAGWNAVIWSEGDTELNVIGTLGGSYSYVYGLNSDGSVAVGQSNGTAFRWSDFEGMSALDGNASTALGVSADGSRVVGARFLGSGGSGSVATVWDWAGPGNVDAFVLGYLPGGASSEAWAVSDDGSVVVGDSQSTDGVRAFHWTETEGMVSLGVLDGADSSHARAVNADGSVVVGWSGGQAMRWEDGEGMTAIPFLTGGTWSYALDVSADGQIVVGASESDEGVRAFAWNSETVQTVPIDLDNTASVVQRAASDIGAAVASRNHGAIGGLLRELDLTGPGQDVTRRASGSPIQPIQSSRGMPQRMPMAVSVGAGLQRPDAGGTGGRTDIMAALGISDRLALGGFLDIYTGPSQQGLLTFDGRQSSGGIWLRQRNADFTGLTWRIAAMTGGGDVRITRDDILPDTEAGSGMASLDTQAASLELGWGLPVRRGVVIPFMRLSHARTLRSAYDEEDSIGFPLSFARHSETLTTLTLAVDSRFAVGERGTLMLTAGAARDLSRSQSPVTGTSLIPGFEDFSIAMPDVVNETRPFASIGYSHALTAQSTINLSASANRNPWSSGYDAEVRLGFEARF